MFKASMKLDFEHTAHMVERVDRAADGLVQSTAQRIAGRAADYAPRLTGFLASHFALVGGGQDISVTNLAPYFLFVEAGSRTAPAQPSLGPAARAEEPTWKASAEAHMKLALL